MFLFLIQHMKIYGKSVSHLNTRENSGFKKVAANQLIINQ